VDDDLAAGVPAAGRPPVPPAQAAGSSGWAGPFPTTELRRRAGGGTGPAAGIDQLDDSTGTFTRALLCELGAEVETPAPPPPPRPRTEPATATGRAMSAVERGGVRAVDGTRRLAGRIAALRGDERTALAAVGCVLGGVLLAIAALLLGVRLSLGGSAPAAGPQQPTAPVGPTSAAAPPTPSATPEPTSSPLPPAGGEFAVRHSGYCLAAPPDRTDDGAQLVQRPCGVGPDTGFHLVLKPGRTDAYSLIDARTGKCVDVLGASTGDGAPVVQWECVGNDNQTFELRPLPGSEGYLQIVAGHSGKCLDVAGMSRDENAPIQQFHCRDAADEAPLGNQSFKLTPG
jgi:hypothetical protein